MKIRSKICKNKQTQKLIYTNYAKLSIVVLLTRLFLFCFVPAHFFLFLPLSPSLSVCPSLSLSLSFSLSLIYTNYAKLLIVTLLTRLFLFCFVPVHFFFISLSLPLCPTVRLSLWWTIMFSVLNLLFLWKLLIVILLTRLYIVIQTSNPN